MTRKERDTGLNIQDFLVHAVSHGAIAVKDIYTALGVSRATLSRWIEKGRGGTFPDEEEIDNLVNGLDLEESYGLSASDLKVRFGLVTLESIAEARERLRELEEMEPLLHPSRATGKGVVTTIRRGNVKDSVRKEAPPL